STTPMATQAFASAGAPLSQPETATSSATVCPVVGVGSYPHQAPEIEAVLPASVARRDLTRWSVRGRCWLELLVKTPGDIDPFVAQFKTPTNPNPVDDARLVYGVAGRADTQADPPYFVFAAVR